MKYRTCDSSSSASEHLPLAAASSQRSVSLVSSSAFPREVSLSDWSLAAARSFDKIETEGRILDIGGER